MTDATDADDRGAAPPGVSLVLAGAVAKGAFHAGALTVIAEMGIRITKVVGTSSGALNGCVYAAAIRAGKEREGAARLAQRWIESSDWDDVFSAAPGDILGGRGLSSMRKILRMLKESTDGWTPAGRPIALDLVVSPLRGSPPEQPDDPTTYEYVTRFCDAAFDTAEKWDEICRAAAASASFPGVFAPVEIPALGPCVDGGAVNNTPIRHAIEGSDSDVILVVDPHPERASAQESPKGANLVLQLADILIHERLQRDLAQARSVNRKIEQLDALVRTGRLAPDVRAEILRSFAWRPLRVIPIRPDPGRPLSGNAFAAFFDGDLRREYVKRGIEAARSALSGPLAADLRAGAAP